MPINNQKEFEDEIKRRIQAIAEFSRVDNQDALSDAMFTLVRIFKESCSTDDEKLAATTLHELRKTNRVFCPHRDVRKVCIFGSARTQPDDPHYQMTEEYAQKITEKGLMVITGAGGGIMEAGNKGAEVNMSFGVNIHLPFEQDANPYIINDPKLISYKYFYTRKLAFIKETDATVLFPGGYGTMDEAFEVLTLLQMGRCAPRPLLLVEEPKSSYWEHWKSFVCDQLLHRKLISEFDTNLFTICNSVEDAVNKTVDFFKTYHSIRYLEERTIIRLNKPVPDDALQVINDKFSHIVTKGRFELKAAKDVKEDTLYYPEKPRLVFKFDKLHFGTLIQLINYLNQI